MLTNKKIGLFITGGIASYKMAEFARLLIKAGAKVRVAMSASACEFITPLTLQVLTKHAVLTETFDERNPESVQHIEFADWCDLAIVAPATANILAKMVHGIADDIVSTTLLATQCPRLIVPAMNVNMYHNPATQRNIAQLQADGYTIMEPETGFLAEGYEGKGRLPELSRILTKAESVLARHTLPQCLTGKRVIISAGGTRERIDPVRYITNDSSGKMGYALAKVATWLGAAHVQLVSTAKQLAVPEDVAVTYVENASQLYSEMTQQFDQSDIVVMAAAVSDYRVSQPATQKIKKSPTELNLTLELAENPDILATLGKQKTHQLVVGFAAETEKVLEYAQRKLIKKQADWIVANDVSQTGAGFNADTNQVYLLSAKGSVHELPLMTKQQVALEIWQRLMEEAPHAEC
ncbi:MAG: bifunctional phosphopantothenoylcysteine decarboxylase/phosphopantothenate--cysteine ligase CoaBC [Aerococcaceae bacterium]|nr:bifunctional phosphopantothenoylcysteine decarboxylase/phosphopantothenate--cysteine ligase CoaBC [Aerococcaceae bacterium]